MTASLIITNAAILTMDAARPTAEAIAVSGNRIMRLGTHAEVMREKGAQTRVIDAGGGTAIPGFVEGHMHLFAGAAELSHLDLTGTRGFDELKARTEAYLRSNPGDDLVIGGQADYVIIGEHEPLSRHHLDRIVKDRPILVFSPDHHTAWANTLALEKAGLLRGKKLGPGNEIVMGPDGLAQGELREGEAIDPVRQLSQKGTRDRLGLATGGEPEPYPTKAEFESDLETMRVGLRHCAAHGITFVQNMDGNVYTLELLEELQRRGELTARVRVPFCESCRTGSIASPSRNSPCASPSAAMTISLPGPSFLPRSRPAFSSASVLAQAVWWSGEKTRIGLSLTIRSRWWRVSGSFSPRIT